MSEKDKSFDDLSNTLPAFIAVISLIAILAPVALYTVAVTRNIHDGNSGTLGDTISGTTGPIIALLSAILVYLSFRAQIRANEITREQSIKALDRAREESERAREESNFQYLNEELEILTGKILRYQYSDLTGIQALDHFATRTPALWNSPPANRDLWVVQMNTTKYLLKSMQNTFRDIEKLRVSSEFRDIINSKMNLCYEAYLKDALQKIEDWHVQTHFLNDHDLNRISFEINATVTGIIRNFTQREGGL